MRLRNALALAALTTAATVPVAHALAATPAATVLLPAAATPAATPVLAPACGDADARDFPLATRIRGGPADYAAGGGFRMWHLEIGNTTAVPCRGVHPVLVLTDSGRSLKPDQIRAEFYDAEARLWRPVAFEATDRAENVGVFADSSPPAPSSALASAAPTFPAPSSALASATSSAPASATATTPATPTAPAFAGFAVPARGTLTVPVRLAFRADATPDDDVVLNAAVVQRRGDDGDWVGESGDYRLAVGPAAPAPETHPDPDPDADPDTTPDPSAPARPTAPGTGTDPHVPELAQTGRESALRHAPVAVALLAAGAAALLAVRRFRNA
ncbi:hypothetical protein [Streptomyces sp. NPDC126499]|uniref:hypothetical protein n=1 Tax=Streptomyces sp. NPDC126499 TaxID=3155314 RepID=UPI0033258FDA